MEKVGAKRNITKAKVLARKYYQKVVLYIMYLPSLNHSRRVVVSYERKWLSKRALDSRPRGRGFEPRRRHCGVSLSKNIYPSLVLVQPRKTRPFITEILLMGRKESNQTNKTSESMCMKYWLTACSSLPRKKCE